MGVLKDKAPDSVSPAGSIAPVTLPSVDDLLNNLTYIKDSTHQENALVTSRAEPIRMSLAKYVEGNRIKVVFYHRQEQSATNRSNVSDNDTLEATVHDSWLKIIDYEFIIEQEFSFQYLQEQVQSRLTGEAICYPGFNPLAGDRFLYEIDNGKVGLFTINMAPTRLTIRTSSFFQIQFELVAIMDKAQVEAWEKDRVRNVAFFNTSRFLSEPGALLTYDDAVLLDKLNTLWSTYVKYYVDLWYDNVVMQSFVRPDGIYDPYIVKFLNTLLEGMTPDFIHSLIHDPDYITRSFWEYLVKPTTAKNLYVNNCIVETYMLDIRSTRINQLIGRDYVKLIPAPDPDLDSKAYMYAFTETMDASAPILDQILFTYFNGKRVDIESVVTALETINEADELEQFYEIPIYLYLIKLTISILQTGRKDFTYV